MMAKCNSHSDSFGGLDLLTLPDFHYNDELVYGNTRTSNINRPRCSVHQRHIKVKLKDWIITRLGGKDTLHQVPEEIEDFETLYDYVKKLLTDKIGQGIGNLTLYDIALRLGSTRNIYPQKYVYLHAAPLKSAKHLKFIGLIKVQDLSFRIETSAFNQISGGLCSAEIENVLCCQKNEILKFTKKNFKILDSFVK